MVVGARALAFLGVGVGVACGDMKDKELKLVIEVWVDSIEREAR